MTQSGFLLGTPGYMAPEQAAGKRALIGPATDIYALGVMLYQLLTGQMPFERDSTMELLRAVISDEPTRPRRLQPRLPRDLEAITLHCLEKEPARRYPSALALAEDLQRFREGKPVLARPVGAVARLARACRRRPVVALLVALLAVSLFGGISGVIWKWRDANHQRDLANAREQATLYQAYRSSLAAASAALQIHDVADAARHLDSAPKSLHGWEWRHLRSRLDDSSTVVRLPVGQGDFSYLLTAPDHRLRVGVQTSAGLRLTDLESGEQWTLPIGHGHMRTFCAAAQVPLGFRVAAWNDDSTAFDLLDDAGHSLGRVRTGGSTSAFLSPDGTRVACPRLVSDRIEIAVFDAMSGKETAICPGHHDAVWALTFSPDGLRLVSVSEDRTACVWDAASGALLATCRGHTSKVLGVAFSPDGTRLVTTSADGTVRQWDARTGHEVEPPYDRHWGEVNAAVYSSDGRWIASAGDDRTVRMWRAKGRQDVAILHGHTDRIVAVAFAPDGRRLASLSCPTGMILTGDGTARVWDLDPEATLPELRGHTNYVYPVAYSPDGRWLASGSWDKTVRLWDAATGESCATLPHPNSVFDLAFSPDGTWLVTGCRGGDLLRIWDVATARVQREFPLPGVQFGALILRPDGTRIAATVFAPNSKQRRLTVYDVASGKSLFTTPGAALAYSPDGRWLAAMAADEATVLLLNAQTHKVIARSHGPAWGAYGPRATFSADSRLLAVCGRDNTVRLYRVAGEDVSSPGSRLTPHATLKGHTGEIFAAAFHPEGACLATAGRDGAVWLWDVARGETVVRLPGHKDYIWSLAFSPDGATLASGSGDGTVRLWGTAPFTQCYEARREAEALRPEAERWLERLWREKNDADEVVKAIRADRASSEALRHAALREVLRRTRPPEAATVRSQDPP
jgi:WD40 repeat protein